MAQIKNQSPKDVKKCATASQWRKGNKGKRKHEKKTHFCSYFLHHRAQPYGIMVDSCLFSQIFTINIVTLIILY